LDDDPVRDPVRADPVRGCRPANDDPECPD